MHGPHGLRIENYVLDLHRRHNEVRPSMLVVHGHHLCNSMSLACRIRLEPHDQTESTKSGAQGVKRSSGKMQKFHSSYVCPQCFLFVLESKAKRRKMLDNRLRQKHVNQSRPEWRAFNSIQNVGSKILLEKSTSTSRDSSMFKGVCDILT